MNIFRHATVVGAFADESGAERAIAMLHRVGFTDRQIGIAVRGKPHVSGADDAIEMYSKKWDITQAAATFGLMGALLGFAAIWCVSGVWPISASDYFIAALVGAIICGTAGGFYGDWVTMDISRREADYLENQLKTGHAIVTVRAGARWSEAVGALRAGGACHVGKSPRAGFVPRILRAVERLRQAHGKVRA